MLHEFSCNRLFLLIVLVLGAFSTSAPPLVADELVYTTKLFSFEIPDQWYFAIPSPDEKNFARCFLKSKLRLFAKGRFIVDVGGAAADLPTILDSMEKVMVPKGSLAKVTRKDVKLDGADATLLLTESKDYHVPCAVIVCLHGERLYMPMLSLAETEDLKHRDVMVESLLETWKWKSDVVGEDDQ
ncbi:hypothetical protein LOC67_24510 [Stieleria sp. JC731]|uniref:hypothetical protein n=1 Tax=Pirellulaceae TaxID=2691357 RepID=UPI001E644611|nr:hypothetical protein [Stieleria sp. JC731]MCC9603725.1 hypothetical protein [Stieleria sp. JC731]